MKYFSMFSGIGGFELGIQRAFDMQPQNAQLQVEQYIGSDNSNSIQRTASCVGYSEIDKYAIKVYERHFGDDKTQDGTSTGKLKQKKSLSKQQKSDFGSEPNERQYTKSNLHRGGHKNYGDATTINAKELPDFDLLVGGFPCQAFSVAGKRLGFNETRGTLFFDIARILKEKQPRHLVLENVKGLLSHDSGRTFSTIIGVLTDLGYFVEWQVLNSKDFGVPQNRERVFIVGHLGGEPERKVFPIFGDDRQVIVTDRRRSRESLLEPINNPKHSNSVVDGISPTLNTMQGGNRQPFIAAQRGRGNPPVQTLETQVEDKTNTLTAVAKDNYVVDVPRIRRLTPLECERLQAYPDNWTQYGVGDEPISDTQRYKMCGNGVTVNVVQAVMEKLCR